MTVPAHLIVKPFDMAVFGGNGDLALRKLMPAFYERERDGQLPDSARVVGVARRDMDRDAYISLVQDGIRRHVPKNDIDPDALERFCRRLDYIALDVTKSDHWNRLGTILKNDPERARVFYLATAPDLFGPTCGRLQDAGLVSPQARVVLEKPLGHDLKSSQAINDQVGKVFPEERIFRIDHYLGKETVQNLMVLRFANSLYEPLWNRSFIDHVQITVAEDIGVEGRGAYYDKSGALRDMVQNHLLQLVCLVAMEAPSSLDQDAVRDEKLKVLKALRSITGHEVLQKTVRGQYRAGAADGVAVPSYAEEIGHHENGSDTETFVAIKAEIDNWRWAGVPFYLRTGKRLGERSSEIVVQFRPVPHSIFPAMGGEMIANRLVIRLQPDEGIRLLMMTKIPGPGGLRFKPAPLNLSFAETFKTRYPDAYERLLMDVIRGNTTLFMRRDEVEAAWRWVEPILDGWKQLNERPKPYTAGSWGPSASVALIERDGRTWHEDMLDGGA